MTEIYLYINQPRGLVGDMRGQTRLQFVIIFSAVLGLVFSGTAIQPADALITNLIFAYSGDIGQLVCTDKGGNPYEVNGDELGFTTTGGTDEILIEHGSNTKHEGQGVLSTELICELDGTELVVVAPTVGQQFGDNLHISCSALLVLDETTINEGNNYMVLIGSMGNIGEDPCPTIDFCFEVLWWVSC